MVRSHPSRKEPLVDLSRGAQKAKGLFAQFTIKAAVLGAAAVPRPVW